MSDNPAVARLFERHGTRYRWFATVTVMLGTLSVVLASTIINVAVPSIMAQYRLEQDQVHWLATGFLAAMTVGMLLNAWAVARFGSRGAYLIALGCSSPPRCWAGSPTASWCWCWRGCCKGSWPA